MTLSLYQFFFLFQLQEDDAFQLAEYIEQDLTKIESQNVMVRNSNSLDIDQPNQTKTNTGVVGDVSSATITTCKRCVSIVDVHEKFLTLINLL